MINVFKRLAPPYARLLRQFALDVWYGRADLRSFMVSADRYKRRYELEMMEHYRKVGYPVRRETVRDLANEWLKDQIVLSEKVRAVAAQKKDRLSQKLDELIVEKRGEVALLLSGAVKPEGRVASVVSFSDNFEAKALQMGEDAAFDLAKDINHAVVEGMGDVYRWKHQGPPGTGDGRVRKTHLKLGEKLFSYNDPPTTIDEYGNEHTGNPGTDWGCRCWEEPAQGRPLRNYIARA